MKVFQPIAFLTLAYASHLAANHSGSAQEYKLTQEELVNHLFERALKTVSLNHADLEEATLGKPGHLAVGPHRTGLRSFLPTSSIHPNSVRADSTWSWAGHQHQFRMDEMAGMAPAGSLSAMACCASMTSASKSSFSSALLPPCRSRVSCFATADVAEIERKVKEKGDEIRQLKTDGISKDDLAPHVAELKALKAQLPEGDQPQQKKGKGKAKKQPAADTKDKSVITTRKEDYSQWYLDVVAAADLMENSPVKGCMVIRPNAMSIWERVRDDLDIRFKATGAQNAYFPLFIPQSFLSKEAEHVDGFAKECAVVTHHRLRVREDGNGVEPDPESKLEEPLIVRPTSETMIWYMFKNWIQSYRDLPLKVNQWANVVRWELRTRPFLRSAEFLWQEGHTAHATEEEAVGTAKEMLDVYADMAAKLLAIPTIKGVKSETERFAGAKETFTMEAMMQNGWALQAGTSHFLGQNFAKAFDVQYQSDQTNADATLQYVWATSWGVSTRLLGAMIMTHSDDAGLVLPPEIAPIQVVVIPIVKASGGKEVDEFVSTLAERLTQAGIRVHVDDRPGMRPGAKYYEWERKGVPLRMDVGTKDVQKGSAFCARRVDGKKSPMQVVGEDGAWVDVAAKVKEELAGIQSDMLQAAHQRRLDRTFRPASYEEMKAKLQADEYGFFLVPWAPDNDNEEAIKQDCKATIRCYPLDLQAEAEGKTCFYSGKPATVMAIFARAY